MFAAIRQKFGAKPATDPVKGPLIALSGVRRVFDGGAIVALKSVDLEINPGDCLAILGASGSGKSSLVNLLCGIDRPSGGTTLWEGQPVASPRAWRQLRRKNIGIVFQEFNLIPTLSAVENVEIALFGSGMSAARRKTQATAMLARVGLEARMHHQVTTLSGGERQRVAIARSIANEPKLLLADEPTGNLDSANAVIVADLLFQLREDTGMTLVLVTHDEKLAARCPRRVRIKDGDIIEDANKAIPSPSIAVEATA